MLNTRSVMDQCDAAESARPEALTGLSESREGQLRAVVEMHAISLQLRPNTWIWDVQKRRAVTVAYVIGQHVRDSQQLQHCNRCAALGQALLDLASYAVPSQGDRCQHIIGTTGAEHGQDDLAGAVHRVSLPVIFIHRSASFNEESCSLQCVAEFRSFLQRLGVREPGSYGNGS